VGDRYIEDTASGFMKVDRDSSFDELLASIWGASGNKIRYCEDCTIDGGDYLFETVYEEDE
jgi:hypothetical protein